MDDMPAHIKQFHQACMNWLNSAQDPVNRDDSDLRAYFEEYGGGFPTGEYYNNESVGSDR